LATTTIAHEDANIGVTISNIGFLLSAYCHLAGVVFSRHSQRTIGPNRGIYLGICYTLALSIVGLITLLTFLHWFPVLFIEGQGGSP
jgi:hypothetical protein